MNNHNIIYNRRNMKLQKREYIRTEAQMQEFIQVRGRDTVIRIEGGMTSLQQLHTYLRNAGVLITQHYLIKVLFKLGFTTQPHPACSTCGDKLITRR